MKQFSNLSIKQYNNKRGVTLIELLVAIVLFSLIVLVLSTIDLFSRHQVISSGRQAELQNEVSYILDYMSKEISRAIGNERVNGADSVVRIANIGGDQAIWAYIDWNGNGQRDFPPTAAGDRWIAYRFRHVGATHEFWYCPRCNGAAPNFCDSCTPGWGTVLANTLSRRIEVFTPADGGVILNNNFIEVQLTACWDPDGIPDACGTTANPSLTMSTRIKMPSVSTN